MVQVQCVYRATCMCHHGNDVNLDVRFPFVHPERMEGSMSVSKVCSSVRQSDALLACYDSQPS